MHQAARIAENLHDLFSGNGQQASQAHGLRSSAASRAVVSETKTSSRLGRIFSMRPTAMPRSAKIFSMRGMAAAAFSHHQVQRVAEDRRIHHAGRRLQRLHRLAQRLALDQQQFALHRVALQLRRRAQRDDLAAKNQRQSVAVLGLLHVMRSYKNGNALLGHLMNQIPELAPRNGIDAGGRLIEKDNRRLMQHRAAQRQPLLPSARQRAGNQILLAL